MENIKYYDINWSKVKTIKDMKAIIQVIATKLQIDHNDENDLEIYNKLKYLLIDTDEEILG